MKVQVTLELDSNCVPSLASLISILEAESRDDFHSDVPIALETIKIILGNIYPSYLVETDKKNLEAIEAYAHKLANTEF